MSISIRTRLNNLVCRIRHPFLSESFAIPSHLTNRERLELARLAQAPGLRTVVEIGSYLGASAAAFGAGLAHSANVFAKIYCVDTWKNDAMTEGQHDTMAKFLQNTAAYRNRIVTVRGWSTEVVETIAGQVSRIDLLFIDGDHSYAGCLADWKAYAPLLAPGARVAFHDVGWAEGVRTVISEEVRSLVVREARLPNMWWGELA